MIKEFEPITDGVFALVNEWEPILMELENAIITTKINSQNRTIKQIIGHMIDSASNNTHRMVHLQYQASHLTFPNYATNGNNDRWIAIQNYQDENWTEMIQLWKYSHLHWIHVVKNVKQDKLEQVWNSESKYGNINLSSK